MTSITADHIAILLGILFILFALYQSFRWYQFLQIGVQVSATIIDFVMHSKRGGFKIYFPILEFYTEDEKRIHIKSYVGYDQSQQQKIGDQIEIIYNPNEPDHFILKKSRDLYFKVIGSFGIGLIFIVFGYFKLFSYTP